MQIRSAFAAIALMSAIYGAPSSFRRLLASPVTRTATLPFPRREAALLHSLRRSGAASLAASAGRRRAAGVRRGLCARRAEEESADDTGSVIKGDNVLRVMSDNAEVSVLVADATELVQEAQTRHNLSITATVAMGRTLIGALLLASFKAEGDAVQIKFNGRGPLGDMLVIAGQDGFVKGRVSNTGLELEPKPDGSPDIATAIGKGALEVVRSNTNPYMPFYQPYTGVVPIQTGEVAEDIAYYLAASEQTSSAIGLGVVVNKDGTVMKAGGWHIQVLPMASEETLTNLEANIQGLGSTTTLLAQGTPTIDIARLLLLGLADVKSATFSMVPKYGPCEDLDLEERMKRAISAMGQEEVDKILDENGGIVEISCDFCRVTKRYDKTQVDEMFLAAAAPEASKD